MATTIAPASMTVSVSETIVINGQSMGSTNTLSIAAVTEVFKRIVTVPTSAVTIYSTHDTASLRCIWRARCTTSRN